MHSLRKLMGVSITLALLVGATAFSVKHGDRALMVSPPDAVAEGFVREVVMKRYTRAEPYLQHEVSEEKLAALQRSIEAEVGEPIVFDAKIISSNEKDALVNVRLESGKGSQALGFTLQFDGEWKIILD